MRLTWLADVLRAEGLSVLEHENWRGRGRELGRVDGIVCHHTATGPKVGNAAVASLLIGGRVDLPGPLCHLGLDRTGTFHVIAAGRANHNIGEWGNQSVGIEAFNDGVGEVWPPVQVDAYVRGCAAIARRLGLPAERVKGHKETDPRRKVDPRGIDMAVFRGRVACLLSPETPREDVVVRNYVASLVAPNGGTWHLSADGGIFTDTDGLDGPMAPFYGSVPGVGGAGPNVRVKGLLPHGLGYKVVVQHIDDESISYFHFPAT